MNRETQRDAEYRTTKRRKTLNDNGMGLPILARKSVDGHSMQTYLEKIRYILRETRVCKKWKEGYMRVEQKRRKTKTEHEEEMFSRKRERMRESERERKRNY